MAAQPYQIVMRTGPNPGNVFELEKSEIIIGRDLNVDIVITDSEVSRKHCRLIQQGTGFVLEDLGSTNGTFVNGQRLMGPHVMRPGETISLGENVSLSFEAGFDADATMVAGAAPTAYVQPPVRPAPAPQPVYQPPVQPAAQPVYQAPPPQPVYSGQVPQGEVQPYPVYAEPAAPEPVKSRRGLLIGLGCLVVVLCVLVVGAFAFDYLNLYCSSPLSSFFVCP